jgi:hypothetical protein
MDLRTEILATLWHAAADNGRDDEYDGWLTCHAHNCRAGERQFPEIAEWLAAQLVAGNHEDALYWAAQSPADVNAALGHSTVADVLGGLLDA